MEIKHSILINCSEYIHLVLIEDILHIEAYQNYAKVYLSCGKMILSLDCLKQLQTLLNIQFFQCHKSHIINLDSVLKYYKKGEVELIDHSISPVSRRKKDDFLKSWTQWHTGSHNFNSSSSI